MKSKTKKTSDTKKKNITISKNKLKIRRIDEHYRFALDFFWKNGEKFFESIKYDPEEGGVKIYRVGFVGFGEYAYEFLKVLCCLGQLPKCRLIIYIFDKGADDRKARFQKELLEHCVNQKEVVASGLNTYNKSGERNLKETTGNSLKNINFHDSPFYEIHFVKCDVEKNHFYDNCFIRRREKKVDGKEGDEIIERFTHMFFMLGSDKANINVATNVSIAYQRNPEKPVRGQYDPQFYVMVKSDDTTAQLNERSGFHENYPYIQLIGTTSERYSFETVEENELENLGIRVHLNYAFNNKLNDYLSALKELEDKNKTDSTKTNNDKQLTQSIYDTLKKETLDEWGRRPIEHFIAYGEQYPKILAEWYVPEHCTQKLADNLNVKLQLVKPIVDEMFKQQDVKNAIIKLYEVFEEEKLKDDYNKKEYYRRSSKSRALFEKLLCQLGYLEVQETKTGSAGDKIVRPNNVVSEFGVKNDQWELPKSHNNDEKINPAYNPKNIPVYKIKIDDSSWKYLEQYHLMAEKEKNYTNSDTKSIKITPHIDVQWFEVNNILQKRWMVFRWGEGYIESDNITESTDLKAKKHKYLRPYIEFYSDDDMRMRHTIDVLITGMANTYAKKIENQQTN